MFNLKKCKGCGLCQNICPNGAITMSYNYFGFLEPKINSQKCMSCGLCKNACILSKRISLQSDSLFYVASSKSSFLKKNSTSGGVFYELAASFLKKSDSVVYGAIYKDTFIVGHYKTDICNEICKFSYSKYMQSDTSEIYKEVKKDLILGKRVLFSGTPCQIYALKKFLSFDYKNLFTIDLVCYGIASNKFIKDYCDFRCNHSIYNKINFRSKLELNCPSFTIYNNDDVVYCERFYNNDSGLCSMFSNGIFNRESCKKCEFQVEKRVGDITLGDYVDAITKKSGYNENLLMVNTVNGKKLLLETDVNLRKLNENEISFSKNRLNHKTRYLSKRKKFLKIFTLKDFQSAYEYASKITFTDKLENYIFAALYKLGF